MKKIILSIAIVVLTLTTNALTAEAEVANEVQEVVTKAQGQTRQEAIKNGLYQAVAQTNGVNVKTEAITIDKVNIYKQAQHDIDSDSVDIDVELVKAVNSSVNMHVNGQIKSYQVIEEKKIDDSTYQVTLKTQICQYIIEKDSRLKVAVLPLETSKNSYEFDNLYITANALVEKLTHKLNSALLDTGKYSVLDRTYMKQFMAERNIVVSSDSSIEEKAKAGQVLGTDYILAGKITNLKFSVESNKNTAIGRAIDKHQASFSFDYSLLLSATRQLKLTDTTKVKLNTHQIRELIRQQDSQEVDYDEILDFMIEKTSVKIANTILTEMFPLNVIKVDENAVTIDNQAQLVSKGTVLNVFSGEKIVATVEITNIDSDKAQAKVIDGDILTIAVDMKCKTKPANKIKPNVGAKSRVKRTKNGGVLLPFDK